jgi:hypothetical protein
MDEEKTDLPMAINLLILNCSMDMKSVSIFSRQQQYQFTRGKQYMYFFYKRRQLGRGDGNWEGSTSFGKIRVGAILSSYMW